MGRAMSFKDVDRRLALLERQVVVKDRASLEALTDEELDALLAARPPDPEFEAAVRSLSDDDLDRAWAGILNEETIYQMYRQSYGTRS